MTWTNAFDIGACTVNVYPNAFSSTPMSPEDLAAAGLSVDTIGGVVTVNWDGLSGRYPTTIAAEVVPSYALGIPGRLVDPSTSIASPGAQVRVDGNTAGTEVDNPDPLPNPWDAASNPSASMGMGVFVLA